MQGSSKNALFFVAGLFFFACTKEIKVNLKSVSPQIVIEGVIDNAGGPYEVKITKTVDFKNPNTYPAVSGAQVMITDQTNSVSDTLSEDSAGVYKTHNIQGIPGHSYNLYVAANGQTYTASSTMPSPVQFDSVTFRKSASFGMHSIEAIPNFQDPPGVPNYYTFREYVNGKGLKYTFVFDDRLSDGKYITQPLFADSTYIKVGDTVTLTMGCVDKNVWNYFNILFLVSTSNELESVTPANPASNISNGSLGYFSAQTSQTKSAVTK